jgi:hypothetical protein
MGDYTLDGYVVLGTAKTLCIMPYGKYYSAYTGRGFLQQPRNAVY